VRLGRLLWIARVLVYRRRWREAFQLADFGLSVGRGVTMAIGEGGSIRIGPKLQLREGCEVWALGGEIVVGTNVFFNRRCSLISRNRIEIGSECLFGPNVGVYDHDHVFEDLSRPIWEQGFRSAPIMIGSNVWIGANAVVAGGVTIGDRAVVGANSVVTSDVESRTVVAGVPARVVRRL
jgi:maltose O-acetyltransferase